MSGKFIASGKSRVYASVTPETRCLFRGCELPLAAYNPSGVFRSVKSELLMRNAHLIPCRIYQLYIIAF